MSPPAIRCPFPHAIFALICSLAYAGCGGPSLTGNVYRDAETAYQIGNMPTSWQRIDIAQNDLAFHNPTLGGLVQVNGSCNPSLDIPLTSLTNHLLIGFTDREVVSQELVPMAGREALRTHVRAKLDGVSREILFFVLKRDGCVYDFALITPPGEPFGRGRADFEPFVQAFSPVR